jgi:hypothetical protein
MVSGMSQRVALNKTALGTANWLVNWSRRLMEEMKKQGIERHAKRTPSEPGNMNRVLGITPYTTDDKEPITFARGEIRQLLDEMAGLVEELRRFEKSIGQRK